MILNDIQRRLEALYQIPPAPSVSLFMMPQGDPSGNSRKIGSRLNGEALLVQEEGNSVWVGLFVAPPVLRQLSRENPLNALTERNLGSFWIAVEGVSHFLYFMRRAAKGEPVTQLELELQGEVDKYLLATLLYFHQQRRLHPFLLSRLFENPLWSPTLSGEEKGRYVEALKLAVKFCACLEQRYLRHAKWSIALEKARAFYRMNHWDKIRRLTP